MTNYEKGRAAEWEVEELLEKQGYNCVRSAGSKGPVDVAAFNKTHVRLIQVKYNCKASPADKEALIYFKSPVGRTEREIWTRMKGAKTWTMESL